MTRPNVTPTEQDLARAVRDITMMPGLDWDEVKRLAKWFAIDRALTENMRRTNELIAHMRGATGDAWLYQQEEITRLFNEHDALIVMQDEARR
jgi:hypothetical protein